MKRLIALAAIGLGLLAGPASAQVPPAWVQPTTPFRVIDNVWYVGSKGLSAWLITTPRGHILLDVGMPQNAELVEANIRKLGFKLADVKILLNSHAHFDHSGGLAKLKADTGAKLYASEGDREALERGVYIGSESIHGFDFPPVKVDRVIGEGDKVQLGGVSLTTLLTPGHSKGCTGFLLPVKDHGVQHTAFFFCSASVAANRLVPNPQYPGIVDDYRHTLARLKTIKADVFLAPHAEFFDLETKRARIAPGNPNPFIVPDELTRIIPDFEKGFDEALSKQTAAAESKKP
jgi:metallo-beta-lactamase class B